MIYYAVICSDLSQIKYTPNYSKAVSFNSFPYTAPCDGIVSVSFRTKTSDCSIRLEIDNVSVFHSFKCASGGIISGCIQVAKGDTLYVFNDGSDSRHYSIYNAFFVPYK